MIDLHVNAERQNVSFQGSVTDGGRFRLTMAETGQMYALSILHREGTRFSVTVERAEGTKDNPTFTPIERVEATLGRPAALHALPYFTVVIDGTRRADPTVSRFPAVQPVLATYTRRALVDDYCCVSCGGVIACACAVNSTCGQCCVNPCCKKTDPAGGPTAFLPSPDTRPLSALGQRPCRRVRDSERLYPQFAPASGTVASRS
ncbi:MAG TPA: hypothetical protein VFJ82_18675 [Longimicrobium sp.]|nr:hypothetical protein [Longimicrobium sp.]